MTTSVNILTDTDAAAGGSAGRLNAAIAQRLARFRKGKQQSFDQLAARSGVSKGMIVQIEQGRANPSIATLCRLASGLGVSVADLIATVDTPEQPVQVVESDDARVLWRGSKGGSATLLIGSDGPDMLELWTWTLKPGERFEARPHSAGTLELAHVEQGSLSLEVDGVVTLVPAGASAFAHTDRPHAYACSGRKQVQFAMVVFEPTSARPSGRNKLKAPKK